MNRKLVGKVLVIGVLAIAPLLAQKQPKVKSKGEQDAVMAMINAADADSRIAAAENLLTKYADTEFKSVALQVAAASAEEKNDYEKMVLYAERTLEADPKNFAAMLMLARGIAQRTREFDLDREEKLAKSDKYARSAIDIVKDAPKPRPDVTDEQWAAAKKDYISQAHEALGLAALVRKKNDVAIAEFKTSIDDAGTPDPSTYVRLASAYNQAGRYDDAIAAVDKLSTMQNVHPAVKQAAGQEKMRAAQLKASGAKPAASSAAPAPATVEIKKP